MKFALLYLILTGHIAFGHEGKTHVQKTKPKSGEQTSENILKGINDTYIKDVKPIFQNSCFNCHSSGTKYPWYASMPLAKQLIESDIKEAKEHIEMSNDFPFGGHGNSKEDLEAIGNSLKNDSMPPFRYRVMHLGSGLKKADRSTVQKWVDQSLEQLK